MPVTPLSLTASLTASFSGVGGMTGTSVPTFTQAISQAFVGFLPTIPVMTTHMGVIGTGTGTGTVFLDASTGQAIITASLMGSGLTGTHIPSLALALATGISTVVSTQAMVQVVITGSSNGAGTGTLSMASGPILTGLLLGSFAGMGMTGSSIPQMSQALGQGIATWLQGAVITTIDVGVPVPPFTTVPGAGVGSIF